MADFQKSVGILFREAFEGIPPGASGTWFVEKDEAIFNTMNSVSAEQASKTPPAGCQSLAAHAFHIHYTLKRMNDEIRSVSRTDSWEVSWAKQTASPGEWEQLKKDIRLEYELILEFLTTNENWAEEGWVTGTAALPVHMAYHLGAIRQLMFLA